MVKRKPPTRHKVRSHKREGKPVRSFVRGTGSPRRRSSKTVGKRVKSENPRLSQEDILEKILTLAPLKKRYYFDFKTISSINEMYKRHGGRAHMQWRGRDVTITTHKGVPERDIAHEIGHLHWKDSPRLREEYTSRLRGKSEFSTIERFAVDFEQVYVDIQKGRSSKTGVQRYIRETLFQEPVLGGRRAVSNNG